MPSVSVVLPTLNRRGLASRCVDSLLAQSRRPDEILVVDNGSSDGTPDLLRRDFPGLLTVLQEPRPGVWHARNRGIETASGDVLAFIDDDVRAEPDWIARILASLEENQGMGVGGPTLADWAATPPAYILDSSKALSYLGVFSLGSEPKRIAGFRDFLIGANCAFRRKVFDDGHRFLPISFGRPVGGEDLEFSRRVAALYPVFYDPRIRVWHRIHASKLNLAALASTGFDYGMKKAAIRRPLSPRGPGDLWGVDGWISLFSGAGYVCGSLRRMA